MFGIVLSNMVTLALCMTVGFAARRLKIIDDKVNYGLSQILLKITLPCLIIISMQKPFSLDTLVECLMTLFVSTAVYLFGMLCGMILVKLLRIPNADRNIFIFTLAFGNVGYMGYPIIQAVFGKDALIYTSMANMSFNVLSFTLGVYIMTAFAQATDAESRPAINLKAIFGNIAIIATIIGFVLFATSVSIVEPVYKALDLIGNVTVPLSMMIVGAILAKSDVRKIFAGSYVYLFIAIKLFCIPVLVHVILSRFISNEVILGQLTLLSGMPTASVTVIFAEFYKKNSTLASQFVFLSTLFSIFSIPVVSLLI